MQYVAHIHLPDLCHRPSQYSELEKSLGEPAAAFSVGENELRLYALKKVKDSALVNGSAIDDKFMVLKDEDARSLKDIAEKLRDEFEREREELPIFVKPEALNKYSSERVMNANQAGRWLQKTYNGINPCPFQHNQSESKRIRRLAEYGPSSTTAKLRLSRAYSEQDLLAARNAYYAAICSNESREPVSNESTFIGIGNNLGLGWLKPIPVLVCAYALKYSVFEAEGRYAFNIDQILFEMVDDSEKDFKLRIGRVRGRVRMRNIIYHPVSLEERFLKEKSSEKKNGSYFKDKYIFVRDLPAFIKEYKRLCILIRRRHPTRSRG